MVWKEFNKKIFAVRNEINDNINKCIMNKESVIIILKKGLNGFAKINECSVAQVNSSNMVCCLFGVDNVNTLHVIDVNIHNGTIYTTFIVLLMII